MLFDLPLPELQRYRPEVTEPADFRDFWHMELADARTQPLDAVFQPVPTRVRHAHIFDVEFAGLAVTGSRAGCSIRMSSHPIPSWSWSTSGTAAGGDSHWTG